MAFENPARRTPTQRQAAVAKFIGDFIADRGYCPNVREIADHFGISSKNGVICHLKSLQALGIVTWNPNDHRTIRLVKRTRSVE